MLSRTKGTLKLKLPILGIRYHAGLENHSKDSKALKWLSRALKQGDVDAQVYLEY